MNNENLTLFDRLKEGYRILKKPIVYLLAGMVIILQSIPADLFPWNTGIYLFGGALLWLGYTLLEMLFEIYEKILTQRKELNIIESDDVYKEVRKIVLGSKDRITNIKCIGVAGRNGWSNVIEKLTQENNEDSLVKNAFKFNIDIALLNQNIWEKNDRSFRRIDDYSKTIDNIQKRSMYLEKNTENGSYLKLHVYDHMPNMIGILVNDNYLFITYSYWEIQEDEWTLRAGGTNYFVYDKNDDFGGQEVINRFLGWFDYIVDHGNVTPDSEHCETIQD